MRKFKLLLTPNNGTIALEPIMQGRSLIAVKGDRHTVKGRSLFHFGGGDC
ncbi:MAG: hypothetical protein KME45_17745 [Stenomitos rutilans HA7619-LM2]|nr:hypothetical protein [Stenomitos rutilans HA7619-LM2]